MEQSVELELYSEQRRARMKLAGGAFPKDSKQVLALARRLIVRARESGQADDLFSAVIATVHVRDWLSMELYGRSDQLKLKDEKYKTLLAFSNGLRHSDAVENRPTGRVANASNDPEWEDDDFWEMHARWALRVEGRLFAIDDLCDSFLDKFEAEHMNR